MPKEKTPKPPELLMHYTSYRGYQGIIHPGKPGPYIMKPTPKQRTAPAGIFFTDNAPYPYPDPDVCNKLYHRLMIAAALGIPYENTEYYIRIDRRRLPGVWTSRSKFTARKELIYVTNVPVDVTAAVVDHGAVSDLP
jgi:hypothetical protein